MQEKKHVTKYEINPDFKRYSEQTKNKRSSCT